MAATLDDVVYNQVATRSDLRAYLDKFETFFQKITDGLDYGLAALRVDLRALRIATPAPLGPPPLPSPAPKGATPPDATFGEGLRTGAAKIVSLFAALEKSLTGFGNQVAKFVEKTSPNTVLRWNQAIADLQAVIGQALVPVLESLTGMIRKVADTFASLSPEAKKLAVGLGMGSGLGAAIGALVVAATALMRVFGGLPVLIGTLVGAFVGVMTTMQSGKAIFEAFGSVIEAISSLVEVIASVLGPVLEVVLVPILEVIAFLARTAASALKELANGIRSLLGLPPVRERSSVGAAVRKADIGDIQGYINRAYTSAYQGSVNSVERAQLEELRGIRRGIDELGNWRFWDRSNGRPVANGGGAIGVGGGPATVPAFEVGGPRWSGGSGVTSGSTVVGSLRELYG